MRPACCHSRRLSESRMRENLTYGLMRGRRKRAVGLLDRDTHPKGEKRPGVAGPSTVPRHCPTLQGRNLDALVPKARQTYVRAALRRAYRAASAAAARRQLTALATWLARNGQTDAAASVREGLEETLTVLKLGLPPTLRRFFATTNCIENLIGTLRHVTRNIKRWRDGDMRRRWIGLGLLRAAERFRCIKHHCELGALVTATGTVTAGAWGSSAWPRCSARSAWSLPAFCASGRS